MSDALITLDTAQQAEKAECEDIIRTGLRTFLDVGRALARIQEQHLYADEFETFEEYCRQKLKMSRSYGYRMIEAANIAQNVSPIGDIEQILPNEGVARALATLEPADQRRAARILAKKPNVTARVAHDVVAEVKARGGWAAEKARQQTPKRAQPIGGHSVASTIRNWWAANRKQLLEYPAVPTDDIVERIAALFD